MNKKFLILIGVLSLVVGIIYTSLNIKDINVSPDETDINSIKYDNEAETDTSSAFTTDEINEKKE